MYRKLSNWMLSVLLLKFLTFGMISQGELVRLVNACTNSLSIMSLIDSGIMCINHLIP